MIVASFYYLSLFFKFGLRAFVCSNDVTHETHLTSDYSLLTKMHTKSQIANTDSSRNYTAVTEIITDLKSNYYKMDVVDHQCFLVLVKFSF